MNLTIIFFALLFLVMIAAFSYFVYQQSRGDKNEDQDDKKKKDDKDLLPVDKKLFLIPTKTNALTKYTDLYEKDKKKEDTVFTFDKDMIIKNINIELDGDKSDKIKPILTVTVYNAITKNSMGSFVGQLDLQSGKVAKGKLGGKAIKVPKGQGIYFRYVEGMNNKKDKNLKSCLYNSKQKCSCKLGDKKCDLGSNKEKTITVTYKI